MMLGIINKSTMQDICDAVKRKTGSAIPLKPSDVPRKIDTIKTGSSDITIMSILDRSVTEVRDDQVKTVEQYRFAACPKLNVVSLTAATTIYDYAFNNCSSLYSVYLPSVVTIKQYVFNYCTNLQDVVLPNCIQLGSCFGYCTSLREITLPKVSVIIGNTFQYCSSLKKVELGGATEIYSGTGFYNCSLLDTLIIRSTTIPRLPATTGYNYFQGTPIQRGEGYIYVPASVKDNYRFRDGWSTLKNQIRAIEDYPEICG